MASKLLFCLLLLPILSHCRELFDILYPYGSEFGDTETTDNHQQLNRIDLSFKLPFYGGNYNYTIIGVTYGYLTFATPPENEGYPPQFPVPTYPLDRDHAFIAALYTKANILLTKWKFIQSKLYYRTMVRGREYYNEADKIKQEHNERFLNRTEVDIHYGMIGTHDFRSQYALVVTWANITFTGADVANQNKAPPMNSFQIIVVTDEVRTFVIFNYQEISWINYQSSGPIQSGTPALVGFNAGNGTGFWDFKPFSGQAKLEQIDDKTNVDFKGRYIFRVDEDIQPAGCIDDPEIVKGTAYSSPDSGTMLGGAAVNVSGPCFDPRDRIRCRFDDIEVVGTYINRTRARCIQPMMKTIGWVPLEISVDGGGSFYYTGRYFIVSHHRSYSGVFLDDVKSWQETAPIYLVIKWDQFNLTWDSSQRVDIGVWGYREENNKMIWKHLDTLVTGEQNSGQYRFNPEGLQRNAIKDDYTRFEMGAIRINVSGLNMDDENRAHLWSPLIPLAWYFKPQWEYYYGTNWAKKMCDTWTEKDRRMKDYMGDLPDCPCTLIEAMDDEAGWIPSSNCDRDGSKNCLNHEGAIHCVTSSAPSFDGAGQECCYDQKGFIYTKEDTTQGGSAFRAHEMGVYPYKFAPKMPSLSHYYHDVIPFLYCCHWSENCHRYKYRRESDDCIGYRYPGVAALYGDPHIFTYDGLLYTFNGLGEYVLTHTIGYHKLDIQARFEQPINNTWGYINGTVTTAIAMKENDSNIVEVQARPEHMKWRYRLKILVDRKPIYFDRPHLKFQQFHGVSVWVPYMTLNQSKIVIRFHSGAGVRVEESYGNLHVVSWVPFVFLNQTMGLFGNFSNQTIDDFRLPGGTDYSTTASKESIFDFYGKEWRRRDEEKLTGPSLFTYGANKGAHSYYKDNFRPTFEEPLELPPNATFGEVEVQIVCGTHNPNVFSECRYDYLVTGNRDLAAGTLQFKNAFYQLQRRFAQRKKACGVLSTPKNGLKEIQSYYAGSKVRFSCEEGYKLYGLYEWECTQWGRWTYGGWWWGSKITCWSDYEITAWYAKVICGGILGCLVPIVLLGVCYVIAQRRTQQGSHNTQDMKMKKKVRGHETDA